MQRRQFIELFGGLAITGVPRWRLRTPRPRRIVVVGGGILGASVALHLARRGAEVIVFEKEQPAAGATGNSFAWINATFSKQPYHYHRLNRLSALSYRHLERELDSKLEVHWGGSLQWFGRPDHAAQLREDVQHHQALGYPVRLIDEDEFRILEPNVEPGHALAVAFAEHEGSIDPVHATELLLAEARRAGARVEYPAEVTGLDIRWGKLRGVRTVNGDQPADVVVIAAGVDTPRLAAMAGLTVPLKDSPGLLAHTQPADRLIGRVVLSPGGHLKQKRDGRIVAGSSFGGTPITEASRDRGETILEDAAKFLPKLRNIPLERVTLGWRPLPVDEYPIVGFSPAAPDVYLAVMHSGITLAPLIGHLAAVEILDDTQVDLLREYRLSRFERSGEP